MQIDFDQAGGQIAEEELDTEQVLAASLSCLCGFAAPLGAQARVVVPVDFFRSYEILLYKHSAVATYVLKPVLQRNWFDSAGLLVNNNKAIWARSSKNPAKWLESSIT